ncbi:hypothetical protein F2P81_019683 [Scophthalmus maximus]|uniref:Uncharacterized protein n=1 Tax=Scophthalmus maximus TaxID=52904 RepID=A0A6A4S065_SCOMX|nr:hypothetical protein F2P81_019683 [Scophthalmus maximus]
MVQYENTADVTVEQAPTGGAFFVLSPIGSVQSDTLTPPRFGVCFRNRQQRTGSTQPRDRVKPDSVRNSASLTSHHSGVTKIGCNDANRDADADVDRLLFGSAAVKHTHYIHFGLFLKGFGCWLTAPPHAQLDAPSSAGGDRGNRGATGCGSCSVSAVLAEVTDLFSAGFSESSSEPLLP